MWDYTYSLKHSSFLFFNFQLGLVLGNHCEAKKMSGSKQKQQFVLFNDNSVVINDLLDGQKYQPFLSLLTHKKGTNNNWVLNILMEELLYGKNRINASFSGSGDVSVPHGKRKVVLISFTNGLDYYEYFFKKNTLEDLVQASGNFHFIDCFNGLFTKILADTKGPTGKYSTTYEAVKKRLFEGYIMKRLKEIDSAGDGNNTTILLIDGLEMLLSATEMTAVELIKLVNDLNKSQRRVFISLNTDDSLFDMSRESGAGNPYSLKHKVSEFYSMLYHRSILTVSVKPLDTGRANDVTGTVRVSRGMIPIADLYIGDAVRDNMDVLENEYMFNVRKDSGISLFYS